MFKACPASPTKILLPTPKSKRKVHNLHKKWRTSAQWANSEAPRQPVVRAPDATMRALAALRHLQAIELLEQRAPRRCIDSGLLDR